MNYKLIFCITAMSLLMPGAVQAQYIKPQVSHVASQHARIVSKACLGHWDNPACLKAVSESAIVMVSNYAATLKQRGKGDQLETLKEHCAASTAAAYETYPADAMRSAYTECANIISDISDETSIVPDQSHYQLIVAPVLCLTGDSRCAYIEDGLKKYR